MTKKIPDFSLKVAKGLAPFLLVGAEREMTPEDWAWHFLRLNSDYQRAYIKAVGKQAENPDCVAKASAKDSHEHRTVYVDEQICREQFGLSTWLDPNRRALPPLPGGQSWFAPLRSVQVVSYSHDLAQIDFNSQHRIFGLQKGPARSLAKVRIIKRGQPEQRLRSAEINFSLDCSLPLGGQLATVAILANDYARQFDSLGFKVSEFKPTRQDISHIAGTVRVCNSDVTVLAGESLKLSKEEKENLQPYIGLNFDEREANLPADEEAKNKVKQLLEKHEKIQWQSRVKDCIARDSIESEKEITINIADKVAPQIQKYSKFLHEIREWLLDKQVADVPPFERMWFRLSGGRGRPADGPSDGHRLKAYVLIKECWLAGITETSQIYSLFQQILSSTEISRPPDDDWTEFLRGREQRLAEYAKDVDAFVSTRYKWLVHTQRPSQQS